jgi:uncharacterized protein (TIGR02145 family)
MRKIVFTIFVCLFCLGGFFFGAKETEAAIAYGDVTTLSGKGAATTDALTAPSVSGSDTVMILFAAVNAANDLSLTASYAGASLGSPDIDGVFVNYIKTAAWIVVNPTSAGNFVVSGVDQSCGMYCSWALTAIYYTGVEQSTTYRTGKTGTGLDTPATVDVTNSQSGDLIVGLFGLDDTADSNGMTEARIGGGQVYRSQVTNGTSEAAASVGEESGASGTVTHSWAFVNDANNGWSEIAIPLIPVGGDTSGPPPDPHPGLSSGLIGYWTFDGRDTINNVVDRSGYNNTGYLQEFTSTTTVPGKIGQALKFNGNGNYVEMNDVADGTGYDFAAGASFTLSAWIKPDTLLAGQEIIMKEGGFGANYSLEIALWGTNGQIGLNKIGGGADNDTISSLGVKAGVWNHVIAVKDGTTVTFYINGVSSPGDEAWDNAGPTDSFLRIGKKGYSYTSDFGGGIDDVRIYNRALSAGEVGQLYNFGRTKLSKPPNYLSMSSGLVGYWTFDGSKISGANAIDSSGLNNTGTITGAAPTVGKLGQALKFNAGSTVHDRVSVSDKSYFRTAPLSVSFWVNFFSLPTGSNQQQLVMKTYTGGYPWNSWNIYENDEDHKIHFEVFNTEGSSGFSLGSDSAPQLLKWYHVVATIDGSYNGKMYINAVQQSATGNSVSMLSSPGDSLTIGAWPGNNDSYAKIDEVRVYSRALSAEEVGRLYKFGSAKMSVTPKYAESSGLVGHWTFDGKDLISNVKDVSGNNNNGYLSGFTSTTTVPGKIGQGLKFNGSSNYVNIGTGASLNFNDTAPWTFSAWLFWKGPTTNWPGITGGGNSGADGILFNYDNPSYRYGYRMTTSPYTIYYFNANSSLDSLNKWQYVTFVADGAGNLSLYKNGAFYQTLTEITGTGILFHYLGAAYDTASQFFNGIMDDVRIYSRALSVSDIQALYNSGKGKISVKSGPSTFVCGQPLNYNGDSYATVYINGQCWMGENLRTTKKPDGVTDISSYCYPASGCASPWGRLYDWDVAMNGSSAAGAVGAKIQGICPADWHIPSDYNADSGDDMQRLSNYLGGDTLAGGHLKKTGTDEWNSPNTGADNSSNFTAYPAGDWESDYANLGIANIYWSSSQLNSSNGWYRLLLNNEASFTRGAIEKNLGFSVRCVKD